jgi:TM2 domain-containing membrane protein YozV
MTDTAAPKTKLVAGLLGIFLGSIGIHKFYLGDTKAGVIRIVVTVLTLGIGGIWGFIEGIMLLVNGGKDVNGVDLV